MPESQKYQEINTNQINGALNLVADVESYTKGHTAEEMLEEKARIRARLSPPQTDLGKIKFFNLLWMTTLNDFISNHLAEDFQEQARRFFATQYMFNGKIYPESEMGKEMNEAHPLTHMQRGFMHAFLLKELDTYTKSAGKDNWAILKSAAGI